MAKGMGRGEGFSWTGDILACLPEEVNPGAVFPLRALDADLVSQEFGPLAQIIYNNNIKLCNFYVN